MESGMEHFEDWIKFKPNLYILKCKIVVKYMYQNYWKPNVQSCTAKFTFQTIPKIEASPPTKKLKFHSKILWSKIK